MTLAEAQKDEDVAWARWEHAPSNDNLRLAIKAAIISCVTIIAHTAAVGVVETLDPKKEDPK